MRIAFLPSFRIAAGLLLVVLLGVVGSQVLRRRNPCFQECALAARIEVCAGYAGQDPHRA